MHNQIQLLKVKAHRKSTKIKRVFNDNERNIYDEYLGRDGFFIFHNILRKKNSHNTFRTTNERNKRTSLKAEGNLTQPLNHHVHGFFKGESNRSE